jgi:hypothetical protein
VIQELWGGEFPELEDTGHVNALFQGLMSFWNHLAKHQSRSKPFRLAREPPKATQAGLLELCRNRTEELEGFVAGLFGNDEEIDLPERAVEGMDHLAEINAMLHAALRLLEYPKQLPTDRELADTLRNVKELSRVAEEEIHAVILSCVRARREAIKQLATSRPTMH